MPSKQSMMTLDLLIINFNQKINLVSGMSQLPMSGQYFLLVFEDWSIENISAWFNRRRNQGWDETWPPPSSQPGSGQGCVTFNIAIPHYLSSLSSLEWVEIVWTETGSSTIFTIMPGIHEFTGLMWNLGVNCRKREAMNNKILIK